ncbi:hypothetical protein [Sinomonas terrae]|uniref:Integrase n=1 Tax=Sinomonas terrae TaxID=2908838 RepID=A0ABS9U3E4_9MICC|nr:hypothetical protein [Sinomonas terrae]MCH6471170.1 hypothetical protein [Sinomonas terrae]
MGSELSMATRREITKKYARGYAAASKKERGRMLDELVATTGWSRANARRQVRAAAARKRSQRAVKRAPRPRTYGYDTLRLLIRVWRLAGQPSGKYLAATMPLWLPKLEEHGEFGEDAHRLTEHRRAQLLAVSAATIDRLLKPTRDGMALSGKQAEIEGTTERLRGAAVYALESDIWNALAKYYAYTKALDLGTPVQGFEDQSTIFQWLCGQRDEFVQRRAALEKFVYKLPGQLDGKTA